MKTVLIAIGTALFFVLVIAIPFIEGCHKVEQKPKPLPEIEPQVVNDSLTISYGKDAIN